MQFNEPFQQIEPPIPEDEEERLKELHSFDILYTLPEEEFDALSRLACKTCEAPISFINLIDSDFQWTKSCVGATTNGNIPRSESICQYTIMSENIFTVEDLNVDKRFKDLSYVKGTPNYRFYAGAPLVTENRNCVGSLCVLDYEPRKLTESQLEDLQTLANEVMARLKLRRREKKLQKLNNFKDRLMKVVSHDIRNPLSGIVGAAECLQVEELDADEKLEMLEIISESAGQIQNIVSELLDNELVQFGDLKKHTVPYRVSDGLKEIMNLFKFSAKHKKIDLKLTIDRPIPTLKIDKQKYERIVANLLSNAIKFTPQDGLIKLECGYKEPTDSQNVLITKVKDNGIGMTEEMQEKLFQEKNGIGRPGTDNETSYGLGMHIVKQFCEVCNADIRVNSTVNKGTTFTIKIPAPQI